MNEPLNAHQALCRLLELIWTHKPPPTPESIHWLELLDLLKQTNLGATVYALSQDIHHNIPTSEFERLQQAFYWTVANNERCLQQLKQLDEVLSPLRFPFMLLKGAALSMAFYPSPAGRFIGDIDLLLQPENVPICRKTLVDLGYTPCLVEHQPGSLLAHKNQELFSPPPPYKAYVELHWHLLDVPYYLHNLPLDWFWKNTTQLTIDDRTLRVLNPEANLVYLPAHLALHHRLQGFHQMLDIALLIEHPQTSINWPKVVEAAQAFELARALEATLKQLAQWWPDLSIQTPLKLLEGTQPSKMDQRLFRLLSDESRTTTLDFYTTLVSLPNAASRLEYAWTNLFPQPAYMYERYGFKQRWQLPYWYLHRLASGFIRIGRMLPRAVRIDKEPGSP